MRETHSFALGLAIAVIKGARLSSSRRRSISSSAGPRGCSREIVTAATLVVLVAAVVRVPRRLEARVTRLLPPVISAVGLTAVVAAVYARRRPWARPASHARGADSCSRSRSPLPASARFCTYRRAGGSPTSRAGSCTEGAARLTSSSGRSERGSPAPSRSTSSCSSSPNRCGRGLALDAAEIWTCSGGVLERIASEPERGPATLRLTASEESILAHGGVCGPARSAVWLPELLADRGDAARARRPDRPRRRAPRPDRRRALGGRRAVRRRGRQRPRRAGAPGRRSRSTTRGSTRRCRPRSTSCAARPTSCGSPARASSPPPTPSAGGSSATCTTAPSSTSSRWR